MITLGHTLSNCARKFRFQNGEKRIVVLTEFALWKWQNHPRFRGKIPPFAGIVSYDDNRLVLNDLHGPNEFLA